MIGIRRPAFFGLAVVLVAGIATSAHAPRPTLRCSLAELPSQPPSLFFTGRATALTTVATVDGAGARLAEIFSGSVPAQYFDVERIGGMDLGQVPAGSRQVVVVPWAYVADCSARKWSSPSWVAPGTSGFVYGRLRAREHWVDGVPTIDVGNSYQLPYPRRATRTITAADAFTMASLLPHLSELEALGPAALLPMAAWIEQRPDLAEAEPARFLTSSLSAMTHRRVRNFEPEIAGTYRFTFQLGDDPPRTFYGRTESHATTAHRVEAGPAYLQELRPPRVEGYSIIVAVADAADALPTTGRTGRYRYMYVDLVPERMPDGSLRWQAGAELGMLSSAFPEDPALQRFARLGRDDLRHFLDHNVPPHSEAWFRTLSDGRVTFEQRYRLPDGTAALLRGERISTVAIPAPR